MTPAAAKKAAPEVRRDVLGRRMRAPAGGGEAICEAIWKARVAARVSQDELSTALGVTQGVLSRWESDREPRLSVLVDIEEFLGLERGTLLRHAGFVHEARTAEDLITADPGLSDAWRESILEFLKSARRRSAQAAAKR